MGSTDGREVEELLLRLSEFGAFVSKELAEVVGDEFSVQNASVMLLSRLDLEGPLRPHQIAEMENMTTGGVSKFIDRLESDGLVERRHGVLATDHRAVLVVITRTGRELIRRMAEGLAERLAETELMVKEINRLLEIPGD